MSRMFVHQLNVTEYVGNYTLKTKSMYKLISLHPLKNTVQQYIVDNFFESDQIDRLHLENIKLYRDVYNMAELMEVPLEEDEQIGDISKYGKPLSLRKFVPKNDDEVLKWDYIEGNAISSDLYTNPKQNMMSAFQEGVEDLRTASDVIFDAMKKPGFRVVRGFHSYIRMDPLHGLDAVLNLQTIFTGKKGKGIENFYYQRQFTGLEIRETLNGTDIDEIEEEEDSSWFSSKTYSKTLEDLSEKTIHFMLPLSERFSTFERFIGIFEELCLKKNEKVTLTTILYRTKDFNEYNDTATILKNLQEKYSYTNITIVTRKDAFARGVAIEAGVEVIEDNQQDLLFFVDVDMVFDEDTLYRIRANTIRGSSVYFPIVFNEYDPTVVYNATVSPDHFVINEDSGYWIHFGFGIASVHKCDLKMVGGFDTTIHGWGGEDVDVFNKFISFSENITIFRAVDPGLVHVFHPRICEAKLPKDQFKMCQGTKADSSIGLRQLAQIVYTDRDMFTSFAKKINKMDKHEEKKIIKEHFIMGKNQKNEENESDGKNEKEGDNEAENEDNDK